MAKSRKNSVEGNGSESSEQQMREDIAVMSEPIQSDSGTNGIGVESVTVGEAVLTERGREIQEQLQTNGNGKPKAPPLSKRERFLKLAPKRVNNVLKALQRLSNCSGKGGYEYTQAEAEKIVKAIQNAVAVVENRFSGTKEASSFTL